MVKNKGIVIHNLCPMEDTLLFLIEICDEGSCTGKRN